VAEVKSSDLTPNTDLAYRAKPGDPEMPIARVRYLGPAKAGKAKCRHQDGDLAGLEEWIATRALLCRWGERAKFLRDEQRANRLAEAAATAYDKVVDDAIDIVLTATGEESGFLRAWVLDWPKARRLWDRAGLADPPDHDPLSFTDRQGQLHVSYSDTLRFAQAFAAAEPDVVARYVRGREEELEARGWNPGDRWAHDYLRTSRPANALALRWAKQGQVEVLQKEADRLRVLVHQASVALRRAGAVDEARRVERALAGE
jgi:hypothetical protein